MRPWMAENRRAGRQETQKTMNDRERTCGTAWGQLSATAVAHMHVRSTDCRVD